MNPLIKEWLVEMYNTEIENTKKTISNERIWANGSDNPEVHLGNIETLEEYIETLEELKEEIS